MGHSTRHKTLCCLELQPCEAIRLCSQVTPAPEQIATWTDLARAQATKSQASGGIPIGAVLVHGPSSTIVAAGHNKRVQNNSNILHGEMDCFENAGRSFQGSLVPWKECICITTLSPCLMCTGAILMYGVPIVVIAENDNYLSPGEQLLQSRGVQVIVCNDARCISMMGDWIKANPAIWNEDVAGDIEGARSAVDCFSTLVHGSLDGDHR